MSKNTNIPELTFAFLESSPHIAIVFDVIEKKVLFINKAFEEITGKSTSLYYDNPEELMDLVVPDDKTFIKSKIINFLQEKTQDSFEFKIWGKSDQKQWISLNLFYGGPNNIAFGTGQLISLRKEYELNLLNINERKNNVLHIIGHDLRGPLEHIQTFIGLLEAEYEKNNFRDFKTYLKFMKQACLNSTNLISELLTIEYFESEKVELNLSRIEIISRIKIIFETYRLAHKEMLRELELYSENDKVFLEVDELKFMLIFTNLISNAYKFTKDHDKIVVRVHQEDEAVTIIVEDTGIGIPDKLQPFLFDKFSKARRPGIHGEKPVGLGLNIIKTIVGYHKGEIWFESKENVGTKFFVKVPRYLSKSFKMKNIEVIN